jgi:membrane associated rhomboid family serine protease
MSSKKSNSLAIQLSIVGFIAGGVLGFLYRPSVFLIGQLPFDVVITRGTNLKGMDQVLISMAQTSFNNMAAAAVAGAVIGIVVGFLMSRR